MTDLSLTPEPIPARQKPDGWRCSWLDLRGHPPTASLPQHRDFSTREEAESFKAALKHADVAVSVTPIWPRAPVAATGRAAALLLDAAGWPRQTRPGR